MDRVQIAAIVVAAGLLLFWFTSLPTPPPSGQPASAPAEQAERVPFDSRPPLPPAASRAVSPSEMTHEDAASSIASENPASSGATELENDVLRVEVSHLGARLRSIELYRYADRLARDAGFVELVTLPERGTLLAFLGDGPLRGLESREHRVVRSSAREVELRIEAAGAVVTRTVTLDEKGYGARLRIRVENTGAEPLDPTFQLAWYGQDRPADAPDRFQNYSLVVSTEGEVDRSPLGGGGSPFACGGASGVSEERVEAPVEWGGIDSQYFLIAAIPENPRDATAYQGPIGRASGQTVLSYPPIRVPAGGYVERTYRLYLGPKVQEEVTAVDPRLTPAVRQGWMWVRPLVDFFVTMLKWTYRNLAANYGVAIILLTLLVRLVTAPLTYRSMKSMKGMSVIAPEMKELQEKYKGDKPRLQQEMMSLYKRRGINPVTAMGGGCLPMLVQMPFLLALYFALQSSIELRHAPFMLWIQDLSAPEDFFAIAGVPIRPLPLMMGASMILQQKLTPTSATADPSQRQMMMWMSVFFIFIFYSFPSGLVLYWFVSNLMAIAQQAWMNREPAGAASDRKAKQPKTVEIASKSEKS